MNLLVREDILKCAQRAFRRELTGENFFLQTGVAVAWQPHENGDRVLFVQGIKGGWFCPKGGFEPQDNNSAVATALRELEEETCLSNGYAKPKYIGSRRNRKHNPDKYPPNEVGKHLHFVEVRFHKKTDVCPRVGHGVHDVIFVDNKVAFNRLSMSDARRRSANLALKTVGINWI
tara:strand:+ start:2205 stop:2729 length:525 start_codon:yes stop_codon:yes gene_type:complete